MLVNRPPVLCRRAALAFAGSAVLLLAPPALAADRPVVAAAASVQFALEEAAAAFADASGQQVRLSFGSSGNLRTQILQGAPFEIFLSADEEQVLALHREGRTEDEGQIYALGGLVLVAPHGSPVAVDEGLEGLREAVEAGEVRHFAIANPEHAPYGVAAVEALEHAGLKEQVEPLLVYGENVAQAAQFALSGSAQGGITAYSLALSPEVSVRGSYALIPEDWHHPLRQRMALLTDAGPVAREFYGFLRSEAAGEIFARHGFVRPAQGS